MGHLRDKLLHPAKRGRLVSDCEALVANEVSQKTGLGGIAIKAGYAALNKLGSGFVAKLIDRKLLDAFVDELEPFYLAAGVAQVGFVDHLPAHAHEVANALLTITDRIAERSALAAIYRRLRPMGVKHVEAAVPAIARLVVSHL